MPLILSNGIRINYEERGSGDPLILIMGLGAGGGLWEDHAAYFEKRFRCILMDNRGAGDSDKPEGPYTTRMMAEDTAGLMQELGIEKARVAGISMGSAIAQELALAYPTKVHSLVLISSWSRCDRYMVALFEHFKKMRAIASPAEFMQLLQLWIASAGYYEEQFEKIIQDQEKAKDKPMPLHAFTAQCDACSTHNSFDRLDRINIPTLLTVGEADIFTPYRLTAEIHARLPNSDMLVFPGKGHIHHWEDLKRFNEATFEFLLK